MIRFSRFKGTFIMASVVLIAVLFGVTYGKHKGFARSITFNGGIRFSIMMPAGTGKADLEKAAESAGFKEVQVRVVSPRANQYDLELGPDTRDQFAKLVEKLEKERPKKDLKDLKGEDHHASITSEIEKVLLPKLPGLTADSIVSRETIAASYGSNLGSIAVGAMLLTIGLIGVYLAFRFDFPFAFGAALSLVHDVIMTVGFIGAFQIQPSIPVLAAVLTIVGYSINDTIVIFDRIRENIRDRAQHTLPETMDVAMTQTLSRTIVTSLLTLLSVIALLFGGATSLEDFAVVLGFGIIVGTYSSIFVAAHYVQYYDQFRSYLRSR